MKKKYFYITYTFRGDLFSDTYAYALPDSLENISEWIIINKSFIYMFKKMLKDRGVDISKFELIEIGSYRQPSPINYYRSLYRYFICITYSLNMKRMFKKFEYDYNDDFRIHKCDFMIENDPSIECDYIFDDLGLKIIV
jgi:hypothetical protein